jgi:hypothetical protein
MSDCGVKKENQCVLQGYGISYSRRSVRASSVQTKSLHRSSFNMLEVSMGPNDAVANMPIKLP